MTVTCDLENWFKVTTHPIFIRSVYLMYEPNWARWKVFMLWKNNFCAVLYDLGHDLKLCSKLLQIFYSNELNLANSREYVILTRIFETPSSVMTWAFDIETWFKLLHIFYPKALFWVKNEPDLVKGKKLCFGQVTSDRHTGWHSDLYRALQSWALISNNLTFCER